MKKFFMAFKNFKVSKISKDNGVDHYFLINTFNSRARTKTRFSYSSQIKQETRVRRRQRGPHNKSYLKNLHLLYNTRIFMITSIQMIKNLI